VLRQRVIADREQPPFDRVTMDGVALSHAALTEGRRQFTIQAVQAAGSPPLELQSPAHCIEIMTGAVLPLGSDCIVPVEQIVSDQGMVTLDDSISPDKGQFIHSRGSDYEQGQTLINPGAVLHTPEIAVLASVGLAQVEVGAWPNVVVVSTGDELVEPGQPVAPHQIRSANGHAMVATLAAAGFDAVRYVSVRDDRPALREMLVEALEWAGVIILSGGVSKGKFDYLPGLFEELGIEKVFHRVQQRPGKPLWFGVAPGPKPVFALPGNPVSALVCFHRHVLPALQMAAGRSGAAAQQVQLRHTPKPAGQWTQFLPVRFDLDAEGTRHAGIVELNTSGDFFGLSETAGFVEWPCDQSPRPNDDRVAFYPW
jgi:molybdopterin molybdotransferase